jgi:polyhydroxyalkanoate synthesis regulator phasin
VKVNLDPSYIGYTAYEKIIDDAFDNGKISKENALQVYEESMKGEVDLFNSV